MGEFALLMFVGKIVNSIVIGGYTLAGSYFVRVGVRYVKDYRESIAKEKESL